MRIPILYKDFYKVSHPFQYHPNTSLVYSNTTARTSRIKGIDYVIPFGIQGFIKKYLVDDFTNNFFKKPLGEVMRTYERRIKTSIGYLPKPMKGKREAFDHIADLHKLGFLPLMIKALPEGSKVPIGVPFMTVRSTDPRFYWLPNTFETLFNCSVWGPTTSATVAYKYRTILEKYALQTGADPEFCKIQGHDFSMRGMFGLEAAELSGAGHLTSFAGTDTIPAIDYLEEYYFADSENELIGGSVPATEHAVMCTNTGFYIHNYYEGNWEKIGEAEQKVLEYLITEVYPTGIVSIVIDTWNTWEFIIKHAASLKDLINKRNGKIVFRPDSGDPADILCGENFHPIVEDKNPARKGVVELLWDIFGGEINQEGYKVLNPKVGVIYGDSITLEIGEDILKRLKQKGFASTNVIFGIGLTQWPPFSVN